MDYAVGLVHRNGRLDNWWNDQSVGDSGTAVGTGNGQLALKKDRVNCWVQMAGRTWAAGTGSRWVHVEWAGDDGVVGIVLVAGRYLYLRKVYH